MTDEMLKKANEIKSEIALRTADLEKAKTAFAGLSIENPVARTFIRVSVPSEVSKSFIIQEFIYPEVEILLEYIKRLESYLSILNAEYLAL
jgi:hypothetical protein